jgi:hypothetical protein
VLGLAGDIDLIAAQDTLGRELQDNALRRTNAPPRIRTTPAPRAPPAPTSLPTPSVPPVRPRLRKPKP